jgi:hypothetical protein
VTERQGRGAPGDARLSAAARRRLPTLKEIGVPLGILNTNGVALHVRALLLKGLVRRLADNGSSRKYQALPGPGLCPTCGQATAAEGVSHVRE